MLLRLALLLSGCCLPVGCGKSDQPEAKVDTIIALSKVATTTTAPLGQTDRASRALTTEIFPRSLDMKNCKVTGSDYYESWELAPDGMSIVLRMREGLKWSDGSAISANDAAWGFKVYRSLLGPTSVPGLDVDSPTILSENELRLDFTERHALAPALHLAQFYVFPDGTDPADPNFMRSVTKHQGAWRSAESPDMGMAIESTDPKIAAKRVELRFVPEYRDRILALKNGRADHVDDIQLGDLANLAAAGVQLHRVRSVEQLFLNLNLEQPIFQDVRFRRALLQATNPQAFIDAFYTVDGDQYARRSQTPTSPDSCSPVVDGPAFPSTDALLTELGWVDTDGDGVRDLDGKPLTLEILLSGGNPARQRVVTMLQSQWAEAGIDLRIVALPQQVVVERIMSSQYEIILQGFGIGDMPDYSHWTRQRDGTPHRNNYGKVNIPELTEANAKALASFEPDDWKKVGEIFADQVPAVLLLQGDRVTGTSARWKAANISSAHLYGDLSAWTPAEPEPAE